MLFFYHFFFIAISRKRSESVVRLYLSVSMTISRLGPSLRVEALLARWGGASASPAQHHADLRIHQQGHDEGNVEGGHGGVHHEGRVGEAARGAFAAGCRGGKREGGVRFSSKTF